MATPADNQAPDTKMRVSKPNITRMFALSSNPANRYPSGFFAKYRLLRVPPRTATTNERGQLGEGGFSVCFRCVHRLTNVEYAVKIIRQQQRSEKMKQYLDDSLPREISMLQRCQEHPNIVQLREVITDAEYFYIVTELFRGGSLLLRLREHGSAFSEDKAKTIFKQLLSAVEYMHSKDIIHRDLKPDNVMFVDGISDSVKLIDFGFARTYFGTLLQTPRCSFNYAPAEVLYQFVLQNAPNLLKNNEENVPYSTEGYDDSCDLWSLGAILFYMLSGEAPFKSIETENKTAAAYANDILEHMATGEAFKPVQPAEANSLLAGLLALHPDNRMTIEQVKEHPWLVETNDADD